MNRDELAGDSSPEEEVKITDKGDKEDSNLTNFIGLPYKQCEFKKNFYKYIHTFSLKICCYFLQFYSFL